MRIFFTRIGARIPDTLLQRNLALMTPQLRTSILRFKRWEDRQATLLGKLLLLQALRSFSPESWLEQFNGLDVAPNGKPFLREGLAFNISHSAEIVVLAVTPSGQVGIDIEHIRAVKLEDFSRYLPEVASLEGRGDLEALTLFFDCWTQKEAVLKGHGTGLSLALDQVVLHGEVAQVEETRWYLKKLFIAVNYCCHVATDQPPDQVAVDYVDPVTLTGGWWGCYPGRG